MAKLTSDEAKFINLYQQNPDAALNWIQENEAKVATLFTSIEAIIQLGNISQKKSFKLFEQKLATDLFLC